LALPASWLPLDHVGTAGSGEVLGEANPVAHHVTNIVIEHVDGDRVQTRCKAMAVMSDGRCASATYVDTLRRENGGWRIAHRTVLARRTPLNGAAQAEAGTD
jgi:3-phenylpropionate/cinnamic acid dioxygenase small subunit